MKAITEAVPSDKEQQQNDNPREKIVFEVGFKQGVRNLKKSGSKL